MSIQCFLGNSHWTCAVVQKPGRSNSKRIESGKSGDGLRIGTK